MHKLYVVIMQLILSFIGIPFCYVMQILLCLMQVCTSTGANTDGFIVGNQGRTTSGRFRREVGIFINFGAPSPQAGVITAWNFQYNCFIPRINPYHATFMMYRLNGATSQYQVIPESIRSISAECTNTRPGVTLRGERSLMVEEQFRVEEGDITAVCLPNDGRAPLRIASTLNVNRDGVLSNIREFRINRGEGCSIGQLQTTSFRLQDLDLHQDLQLYLYAEATTVPEIITMAEAPSDSDNAIFTSTIPVETISHDSRTLTSTTNTDIVSDHMTTSHDSTINTITVSDSEFDQSLDLAIIKIIIVTLVPVATVAIVITAAVLVIVVAMMWRRRCARQKNSTSATAIEIDSHEYDGNAKAEFNMDQNVSYNICDNDTLSQHYEYPDLSTTILDESNIYDSIDSQ